MKHSIRRQLRIALISLAVVPLLLMGSLLIWQIFTVQLQQVILLQHEVANQTSYQATAFIQGVVNDIYITIGLQNLKDLNQEEQKAILSQLQSNERAFEALLLIDSEGNELARNSLAIPPSYDWTTAQSYTIPKRTKNIYYSPVWFDKVSGMPLITVSIPFLDLRDGTIDTILITHIRLRQFWDIIADVMIKEGESIYIVDSENRIIAHPNPILVWQQFLFTVPANSGVHTGVHGERVVLAVDRMTFGEQVFAVVTERPLSAALKPTIDSLIIIIILVLAALLFAAILSFVLVGQRIVQPIEALVITAQAIEAGDLSRQAQISKEDEIGMLARAFNAMATQLRGTITTLEEKVTELSQAEAALRESESRLTQLIEAVPVGIFVLDQEGSPYYANEVAKQLLGQGIIPELGKEQLAETYHVYKADNEQVYPVEQMPIVKALAGISSTVDDAFIQHPNDRRFLRVWGAPLFDRQGNVTYAVAAFNDITLSRQKEILLQQQKAQLEALQKVGLELASELDLNILLESIVHQAVTLSQTEIGVFYLCYPEEDILKLAVVSDPNIIPKETIMRRGQGLSGKVWQTGEHIAVENYQAWEGCDCTFTEMIADRSAIAIPVYWGGEIQGILALSGEPGYSFSDDEIALLKMLAQQAAVAIQNANLHKEVKHYTAELEETVTELRATQEQLVRREKLAVLGQLSGGVGHELRTPLAIINNALFYLKTVYGNQDDTLAEYLGIIEARVKESEKIVSDLLDLARSGPKERVHVSMKELVETVLQEHPAPKHVEAVIEIMTNCPPIWVDKQQIKQVLGNLITNAYQAMPDGGQLQIGAKLVDSKITLWVRDTGSGMSEEVMSKIFEPLFTTKAEGIGLGLAISKNLIEINGGNLEVDSVVGKGSTFTITLPTTKSPPAS